MKPLYECKDFGNINKFHILLGPACNMQCRHCSQTDSKTVNRFKGDITEKVWNVIKHYIEYSVNKSIEDVFCPNRKIIFWGGEALLHWDVITKIVDRTKKEFGFTRAKGFQFSIVSNGILLTEEKVNYINENHIGFCFSYDAPYPFAIRDYVSNDVCRMVRKIKGYAVHCSCNAINDDPLLAYRCLKAKFPNASDIDINPKLMQAVGIPKDIYDWNWEHIRNSVRKIRIAVQKNDMFASTLVNRYWFNFNIMKSKSIYSSVENCSVGNNFLNTTVSGEVLGCYNSFAHIGTVDDSLEELHRKSVERLMEKVSPDCASCRHLDICKGNRCWVNAQNKEHQFYACHNYWFTFYDILKEEFFKLTASLSDEDEAWYQEQETIMEKEVERFISVYGGVDG